MDISKLFRNVTLKAKITGLAVILLLFSAGSGFYALLSMSSINKELVAIAEKDIPLTKELTHITVSQLEQAINFERALRHGKEMNSDAGHKPLYETASKAFTNFSKEVEHGLTKGEKVAQEAMVQARTEAERTEFSKILDGLKRIDQEHKGFEQHALATLKLVEDQRFEEAWRKAQVVVAEEERIDRELESLLREIEAFTERAAKTAEAHEHHAQDIMYLLMGLSLLAGVAVAWWVIRDAVRRVEYAISVAETVASGDLRQTVTANSTDEIGRLLVALGGMRDSLYNMVAEMHESSNGLAVASEELSTATHQMTISVTSQREELTQAATAFNQMAVTVQEVARNAGTTAAATNDATHASEEGKRVICGAVSTIRGLAEAVDGAASVIQQLGDDSEAIGAVIDVIKSIAEQTNLLALNAAIEAARAGEQGRGFAVVADEVRTLAQRTQESTQEIEEMIDRLQSSARSAVHSMEGGRGRAQDSVSQATAAGQSLEAITTAIAAINDMNTQIASAAEEQSAVSEDINRSLTSISEAGEHNAAAMTQTSGASEELAKMAASLQAMINRFQIA